MINIAELLKDVPKGMKLYSPLFGEVEFAEVMDTDYVPIRVIKRGYGLRFDECGRYMGNEYPDSECLLFPSKDCRTWEEWKLPSEPKFKVGDRIKWIDHDVQEQTIIDIKKDSYITVDKYGIRCALKFAKQDEWELVPKPHYDISNFKAGMSVLVRDRNENEWCHSWYSHYCKSGICHFNAVGLYWKQCIPFEGNEHLLGTTDMPGVEYINW